MTVIVGPAKSPPDRSGMATLAAAHDLLARAENLLVFAGAGMSAELGVPTYWTGPGAKYGDQVSEFGYTAIEHAHASLWTVDPTSQIDYFHLRTREFNDTPVDTPTSPYARILAHIRERNLGYFAVTSNVDSFFLRAGFAEDHLLEIHGAYRNSQCLVDGQGHGIFPTLTNGNYTPCPVCKRIWVRPNVLFFDDFKVNPTLIRQQQARLDDFLDTIEPAKSLILEVGAGNTVPTIRNLSVRLNRVERIPVIRINPHPVVGVDGIVGFMPPPPVPFMSLRAPIGEALDLLLPAPAVG